MTTSENIFRMVVENTSADLKNDLIKLKKTSGKECCGAKIQHDLFEKTMRDFVTNKKTELPDHLYSTNIKLEDDNKYFFMQKFTLNNQAKIAVVGDLHGGFLNLLNFIIQLIDTCDFFIGKNSLILKQDRYILSLGDLVDRGRRSPEVVWFLCNLYNLNKVEVKKIPKVILLNGNHETSDQYSDPNINYPFSRLLTNRGIRPASYIDFNPDEYYIMRKLMLESGKHFLYWFVPFLYMPIVVFIKIGKKSKYIQYCHGGIDYDDFIDENGNFKNYLLNEESSFRLRQNLTHFTGYRWTDFADHPTQKEPMLNISRWEPDRYNTHWVYQNQKLYRKSTNGTLTLYKNEEIEKYQNIGLYRFSQIPTRKYLYDTQIQCIIRGHQDQVNGFMLLDYTHTDPNNEYAIDAYTYKPEESYNKPFTVNTFPDTIHNTYNNNHTPFSNSNLHPNKSYISDGLKQPSALMKTNKFNKFDVSRAIVITTSTAREARGMKLESFIVVSRPDKSPIPDKSQSPVNTSNDNNSLNSIKKLTNLQKVYEWYAKTIQL